MPEQHSKMSLYKILLFTSTVSIFLLIGLLLTAIKYSDQILSFKKLTSESQVIDTISKIEVMLDQLSQLQNRIGQDSSQNLINRYNQLSDDFNRLATSITKSQDLVEELKNEVELKNKLITVNNTTIEFLDSIKARILNPKSKNKLDSSLYLKLYSDLKYEFSESLNVYDSSVYLFAFLTLGFLLFAILTIVFATLSLSQKTNLIFQKESELATFKSIINNMSEGVVVTNKYGFFTYYNQAAVDIIGPNINDVHYQSSVDQIGFKSEAGDKIEKDQLPFLTALQKNTNNDQDIWVQNIKNPDGIFISASNGFFVNQKAETAGSVVVMKNITHKKLLEKLWNQEKQAAIEGSKKKSDFLASMSHEIRTPMNGIIGLTTLLSETKLSHEQKDYVGTVQRSAYALLSLINDILDHSKIEAGKIDLVPENFNLRLLIKDISENFKFICAEKNIRLILSYPNEGNEYFFADANRIRQILINLIGNAIKFTTQGQVEVRLKFSKKSDATKIRFEIIDTGAGMEAHEVDRLFQRFFQTKSGLKFGGTGLGLSISKQLVDLMGGQIGVSSKINQGSVFWFELDLKNGNALQIEKSEVTLGQLENVFSGHILIAEDNLINQKVASQYIKKLGFTLDIANNGQEAVDLFQKNKYDLIFMDCQMPLMTGYVATKKILELQSASAKCIPIVALTAEGTSGEKIKCFAAGMNDFLNKPLVLENLVALLKKYFKTEHTQTNSSSEIFKLSELKVGDQLLLEILLDDYCSSTPILISDMKEALHKNCLENIYAPAHTLKSASATLSAHKVSQICEKLEIQSTETSTTISHSEMCQSLLNQLEIAYTESIHEIKEIIFDLKKSQKVSA